MEGPNRGGTDGRGGAWQGRNYEVTNQIKQLLRIPTEDPGKPRMEDKMCTPPQNIPVHKQAQLGSDYERTGSPSNKHQRWEQHRYQDGRHRVDSCGSPGRGMQRHGGYGYEPNRTPPHKYHDMRARPDPYSSPNRRPGNYDRGPGPSPRNQHHYQQHQYRGATHNARDPKDMRMNGPRPLNTVPMNQVITVDSDSESPEYRPSPEVLAKLEKQFLFPLKKKSLRFPKAKYFCRLCDYHCDSLAVCRRHIADTRHRKLKEAKDVETTLKNVPNATNVQIKAIDKLITTVAEEIRVTPDMLLLRQKTVAELNDLLVAKVKGCRLEIVGSTISGFCMKTSNINVDIVMDDNLNPATALLAVRDLVGKNEIFKDVVDDLSSSFPTMSFTHTKTNLRLVVGAGSASAKFTNQLLAEYAALDPRVTTLGVVFRYWGQLCQIDDQMRGTLPPHVFPLMAVHFLQQHQPAVLPVLHKLHPKPDGDSYLKASELGDKWQTKNTESIGKLWLEMFKFYTVRVKMTDSVINVRQLEPMTRAEKTWSKKVAIEDPFVQKRNLTRTVSGSSVFEYIINRFKATYQYFAIPQLSFGPLCLNIMREEAQSVSSTKAVSDAALKAKKADMLLESIEKAGTTQSEGSSECELEQTEDEGEVVVEGQDGEEEDDTANMSGFEADLSTLSLEETAEEPSVPMSPNGLSSQEEDTSIASLDEVTAPILFLNPVQVYKLMSQVQEEHLCYKFERQVFTSGQTPPLICGSCQKEGHCKADCQEDELPPLCKLPPMSNHFLNQLTSIFEQLTRDFEPTREEIDERDRIVADLQNYIRQYFWGGTLKLFGSSANGFGFQGSDLDICLTFEGNPSGENIDHIKIIESLAEKLKRYRQCGHVFAITTAKVPIVKFSIRRACLEGDLSLYNTLALQNTKLLYTYSKIDHRVKCLGYAMKYFAKLCDIGDASRGSLSSYAYILMVLHFLQQCDPPVIPVLQELYDHSKPAPQLLIDGWNAWFYDSLDNMKNVWKYYGKNKDSVGQLWVNMLRYYTETFNWKENVVTIQQYAPLTRLQKLWNSRCIAIEDPFDLSHNLGAGLSRKMNTFIMKAFIRGREIFGTAISYHPPRYRNLVDYLFDSSQLTDGAPPNDRGCRFCGKIGHIQKDCPKKKVNIEKRDKKEKQKEMRRYSSAEGEDRNHEKPEAKPSRESQESEERERRRESSKVEGRIPAQKAMEDVTTGNSSSPQTSTTKANKPHQAISRKAEQGQEKHVNCLVSKPVSVASDGKQAAKGITSKAPQSLMGNLMTGERVERSDSGRGSVDKLFDGGVKGSGQNPNSVTATTHVGISSSSSRVSNQGPQPIAPPWGSADKGGSKVGAPPGFERVPQVEHTTTKAKVASDHVGLGITPDNSAQASHEQVAKQQGTPSLANVSHLTTAPNLHQQQQHQHQQPFQQLLQQHRQWNYWSVSPQSSAMHLASVEKKHEPDLPKTYQTLTTTAGTTQPPHQQQQYSYSISPAALFHMASQAAAGGHVSAVLLPSVSDGGGGSSKMSGISVSSPPCVTSSTGGTSAPHGAPPHGVVGAPPPGVVGAPPGAVGAPLPGAASAPPPGAVGGPPPGAVGAPPGTVGAPLPGAASGPPPGFSPSLSINFPGQQVDPLSFNKLVMGSPLYRAAESQPDRQSSVTNSISQPIISVGQAPSGPMAGVYAMQQGSGGQFTSMAVSPHTPHAFGDPSLSQQQVPFDTQHFISQQVSQDLHHGVTQGLTQGVAGVSPGVPQGVQGNASVPIPPPGLTTSVPQGLSQSVPQPVPQGLHQGLTSGVSPVNLGTALPQSMQAVPLAHPLQQHPFAQPAFPQQGYQMTVPGASGYYQEFVLGDPGLQNASPSAQGPPTLPQDIIPEMPFQRPEVYDPQLQGLPQYLSSSLPQHQGLMSQLPQGHPSLALPHPAPLSANSHTAPYTPGSVIYIEGDREPGQMMQ